MSRQPGALGHELLREAGVVHGFGTRSSPVPAGTLAPRQVHGARVVVVGSVDGVEEEQADAIVSTRPGVLVSIVTADCVPILACSSDGRAVVAIHAGWRGLAAGVVAAGVAALRRAAHSGEVFAVVGPHIGACCYEVDAPVTDALHERFGPALAEALAPTREGHARLDLASLVRQELVSEGVAPGRCAEVPGACTHCQPRVFHSFRRDGAAAGRMTHFIAARRNGLDSQESAI